MPAAYLGKYLRVLISFLLPLTAFTVATRAQTSAQAPTTPHAPVPISPILANLTFPIDVTNLKIGARVKARVTKPWTLAACDLKVGSLLEGHIAQTQRRTKTDSRSAVEVVFDTAECSKHNNIAFKATLIAMQGPVPTEPIGQQGLGKAPELTNIPLAIGLRSVESAASANGYFAEGPATRSIVGQWKSGQVVDVPSTNLARAAGANGGSIIWSSDRNVRIEAATTLIFAAQP